MNNRTLIVQRLNNFMDNFMELPPTISIKPVWAGVAVGKVNVDRSPEDSKKRLDYAVTEMFRKLPNPGK